MPKGIIRSSFFEPWREQAGLAATPSYFALRAQRLMRESGLTKEHLAQVCVKNRAHGEHNPIAMFRKPVTAEQVLASRVVCEPLHLWMLCSPNEGAAAVVLRRSDGPLASHEVELRTAVLRSHLPGSVLGEATPMAGIDDADITPPTTLAAQQAYAEAGVGPTDVHVVECQDTDAARRAARVGGARVVRPRRAARAPRRRHRRARRPPARQRERRSAEQGRAARRERRSARWSSSCSSCAALPARARSRARAWGSPTLWGGARTPA